jgi:hypothetical protein
LQRAPDRAYLVIDKAHHSSLQQLAGKDQSMLRIKGMTKAKAPAEVRALFDEQEKIYGSVLNTAKIYGLRPTIQKGVQALQKSILASGLISPDLRHLLCMKRRTSMAAPIELTSMHPVGCKTARRRKK